MELTYHTNEYGHKRVRCPFCPKECFVRESTRVSPNALRNLMRHITVEAKNEALDFIDDKEMIEEYKHLNYYRDHTSPQNEPRRASRKFDDSLSLAN